MTESSDGAVVLLSGGLDSAVLLHEVCRMRRIQEMRRIHGLRGGERVHALSYNYGQRHSKELECAEWQALALGVARHRIIDVSFVREVVRGASALVENGLDVPDLKDLATSQLDQPPTYVPHRNMMLLAIAAAYAEAQGIRDVFYGAQALDEYGYWDCTGQFVERVNQVLALNRRNAVTVHAPFVAKKKFEIVRLGLELGVDFAHTWSCYRGGEQACGRCPTCVERLAAFRQAGAEDPLPYVHRQA